MNNINNTITEEQIKEFTENNVSKKQKKAFYEEILSLSLCNTDCLLPKKYVDAHGINRMASHTDKTFIEAFNIIPSIVDIAVEKYISEPERSGWTIEQRICVRRMNSDHYINSKFPPTKMRFTSGELKYINGVVSRLVTVTLQHAFAKENSGFKLKT